MSDSSSRANLARTRDNQRRSRQRRKEYLQELEEKYRECERRGVEASAEIQAAARKVLEENRKLRALLKSQGVSDAEIDEILLPEEARGGASSTPSSVEMASMLEMRKPCCPRKDSRNDSTDGLLSTTTYLEPLSATSSISPRRSQDPSPNRSTRSLEVPRLLPQALPRFENTMPAYIESPTLNALYTPLSNDFAIHQSWSGYGVPFGQASHALCDVTADTMNVTAGPGAAFNFGYPTDPGFDENIVFGDLDGNMAS